MSRIKGFGRDWRADGLRTKTGEETGGQVEGRNREIRHRCDRQRDSKEGGDPETWTTKGTDLTTAPPVKRQSRTESSVWGSRTGTEQSAGFFRGVYDSGVGT